MKGFRSATWDVSKQIEHEREAARPIVLRLASTIADQWDSPVPVHWRKAGFVDELTKVAASLLETDLDRAQLMAQYAVVVATSIPEAAYPLPIVAAKEAEAWKELANAHRFRAEFDAAMRALDSGDRVLSAHAALDWERAVMRYARAALYADMQRLEEAADLAAGSAVTFAQYRDHQRTGHCLVLKGVVEQRRGRVAEACESYERAIASLKKTDDLLSLAIAYSNVGLARATLRDIAAAMAAQYEALAIVRELASTVETARITAVLGRILLDAGRLRQAEEVLAKARSSFITLRMPEEAGIVGLELVEAFIALDQPYEALRMVEEVLAEFRRAGLNDRAMTALAYLRDLVTTQRSGAVLRHVRAYLEDLRRNPLRVFVPPPEE